MGSVAGRVFHSKTSRIRVCIVVNDFLIGGAQRLIADLFARVDRSRFELSLITLFDFGGTDDQYLYAALPQNALVHRLRFSSAYDLRGWWTLYRTLRSERPDVVFSHLFFSNTAARVLAPLCGYRVVRVEHNTYTKKPLLHQYIDRLLARYSYRIVAVSDTVAAFTSAQEHISPDKFTVIRNGIDVELLRTRVSQVDHEAVRSEFGLAPCERLIINVARVVPQKNHKVLLEGFALFSHVFPQYRLIVVGGGSHLEKMRQYAADLGLGERALFLGYRRDIERLLSASDFFVSTSDIEGFGIAHAEALACGLPVLTTKTAGPDEMVQDGVNGRFIAASTKEAVADGLARMARDDLRSMRDVASRSVERYAIAHTVQQYERLFTDASRA